jgi:CRP-like cAMP-binding protein
VANIRAPSKRLIAREVALGLDRVGDRSADVRTLEQSEFYVADAPAILAGDPTVALYVAAMLARRLDAANRWLVAVKRQGQAGEPPSVIGKAVEKVDGFRMLSRRDGAGVRLLTRRGIDWTTPAIGCTSRPTLDSSVGGSAAKPPR